jgi:hypothetical protein
MTFFPVLHAALCLRALASLVTDLSLGSLLGFAFTVYLVPVLAFRIHNALWPVVEGDVSLSSATYAPWYGAHQFQVLYIALPQLEALLRLVPGLYSAWLRLWGSRVGRGVYWTPLVEILDRNLLDIGDGALFGHRCGMSGHIIRPVRGEMRAILHRVTIGRGAFVGGGVYVGPGAVVEDGALVKAGEHVRPFKRVAGASEAKSQGPLATADTVRAAPVPGTSATETTASEGQGP